MKSWSGRTMMKKNRCWLRWRNYWKLDILARKWSGLPCESWNVKFWTIPSSWSVSVLFPLHSIAVMLFDLVWRKKGLLQIFQALIFACFLHITSWLTDTIVDAKDPAGWRQEAPATSHPRTHGALSWSTRLHPDTGKRAEVQLVLEVVFHCCHKKKVGPKILLVAPFSPWARKKHKEG